MQVWERRWNVAPDEFVELLNPTWREGALREDTENPLCMKEHENFVRFQGPDEARPFHLGVFRRTRDVNALV